MPVSTMTPAQRDRDIARLRDAIGVLERAPVVTPCGECAYFDAYRDGGVCEKWNAPVPIEARTAGCTAWAEGIPF